jgi:flavorubredoxin
LFKKVDDFQTHRPFLEGFHQRYMGSNKLARAWVEKIENLHVNMIAPQHGALFVDDKVTQFLQWFKSLQCGSDLIERLY